MESHKKLSWESIDKDYIKNGWEYISVCHDYIEIAKWNDINKKENGYLVKRFEVKYNENI